jgi:hypothetical protein
MAHGERCLEEIVSPELPSSGGTNTRTQSGGRRSSCQPMELPGYACEAFPVYGPVGAMKY